MLPPSSSSLAIFAVVASTVAAFQPFSSTQQPVLHLDEEYGQTAKLRFRGVMPAWNTASKEELANRKAMNDAAEEMVDKRVSRMSMLPDAIDEILKGE